MSSADVRPVRRFVPEMEARRHILDDVTSWADFTPDRAAVWDAPYGPTEDWDLVIEDRQIDGPNGPVPVRVYRPAAAGIARPGLVWCHGGGFMAGDLDMNEAHEVSRGIAGRTGGVVVSVDYRLCPAPAALEGPSEPPPGEGNRFPVAHDDALAAYRWTREHADQLGLDAARVAIGGASAGANLAAGVALHLRDDGETPWQLMLAYPVVHAILPDPSDELAEAVAVTPPLLRFPPDQCRLMNENYLGGAVDGASPYAFAALSDDLTGFPPTLIDNDEFDDLRASGEAFAAQLRAAGVEVEEVITRGVPHGHLNNVGFGPTQASLDRIASRLTR
jgi:acetyl esterase